MLRDLTVAALVIGVGWLIYRLERLMVTQKQQLDGLKASLTDFFGDVQAKLDQLNAQQGEFTPEAQATFDEIKNLVATKDAEIGDADGSEVTTPVEPTEPGTPAEPVDPEAPVNPQV